MHKSNAKNQDARFTNVSWQEEQEAGILLLIKEEHEKIVEYIVNKLCKQDSHLWR